MITLKTLAEATSQQVFDQVAKHLLTQNEQSQLAPGTCTYRVINEDGKVLKCAAGCLMSNEEYFPEFEGVSWGGLVGRGVAPKEHTLLIQELQILHDTRPAPYWPLLLREFAQKHNLSTEILNHDYSS